MRTGPRPRFVINGGNNEHIAQINFDPNKDDSNDRTIL